MLRIAISIAAVASGSTIAEADCALDRQIFPVPVWATSPNEGNTWGIMPVVLAVCPETKHTHWILAPSVTWNSIVHITGTVRLFAYPDEHSELTAILAGSTEHNYQLFLAWNRVPTEEGTWTYEMVGRVDRSVFSRFFGIGPDTTEDDETSYTSVRAQSTARVGRNLGSHINVGARLLIDNERVAREGVEGLPLAPDVFPEVPGMRAPSTVLAEGLELRYDNREGGDFAERGFRAELWGAVAQGLVGSPNFLRGGAQASAIFPEHDRVTGAARVYWAGTSSSNVPFYSQSSLGGSYLMRGFTPGRFVDRMAWTAEIEQRIRILRTHFFGVETDWRIDPFIAVGQVYGDWRSIVSNPRLSAGIGLRALVRPRVLGRVDLAWGGEGLKAYVELGYPY